MEIPANEETMMPPKELMLRAIKREPVNRIPAATYNFHRFRHSREPAYLPMLDALSQARNVGILCKSPAERRGGRAERTQVERRKLADSTLTISRLDTPKGKLKMVHRKPKEQPGYYVEKLIKNDEDIEKFMSLPAEPAQLDLSTSKQTYEKLGEKGLVYVAYDDPFYSVARLFDFEDLAVRCLQDLPLIEKLIDREFQRIKVELKLMLEQAEGYDFLFYTDGPEVATPPLLPPSLFVKLVTTYETELVKMIKEAGHLASIHCHGKVGAVFDEFLEIGADMLEPMEPPPQGDIYLAEALDRTRGRMCLMGYIQDQDLYTAEPGGIRQKVCAISEAVKGRTGYIMSPTATPFMFPPPGEFVRNYVEFLQTANHAC